MWVLDFVVCYGGEEFVILMLVVGLVEVENVVEWVCCSVCGIDFKLFDVLELLVMVSIGVV